MDIWPEWEEVDMPVNDLHLGGTGTEDPDPLLRSSLMAESFNILPFSFNLISVLSIILSSPA